MRHLSKLLILAAALLLAGCKPVTASPPEQPTAVVTLYISDSLSQRLGGDQKWWQDAEPGTSLLEYDLTPAGVSRLIVSTGGSTGRNP